MNEIPSGLDKRDLTLHARQRVLHNLAQDRLVLFRNIGSKAIFGRLGTVPDNFEAHRSRHILNELSHVALPGHDRPVSDKDDVVSFVDCA